MFGSIEYVICRRLYGIAGALPGYAHLFVYNTGSGDYIVNVYDTGSGTDGADTLIVNGTDGDVRG